MPNWCENNLILEVPSKPIAEALSCLLHENKDSYESIRTQMGLNIPKYDEELGLLGFFMPMPETYNNTDGEPGVVPDWYSWRVNNWGTKWDVNIENWERTENTDGTFTFNMSFDSAWSPPIGFYDYLHSEYDNSSGEYSVYATYIEGGMDFLGYYQDGTDNCFTAGSRDTTDAPDWLVDDYSWHYDSIEEYEQEDDTNKVVKGHMTPNQFIKKWGTSVYEVWKDSMITECKKEIEKEATNG